MGAAHTPGPWQIEGHFVQPLTDRRGFIITHGTNSHGDGPEGPVGHVMVDEADARLISAAPELLIQLRGMLGLAEFLIEAVNVDTDQTKVVLRKDGEAVAEVPISLILKHTKAAIAKAEGR